jgi:CRISPR-associated protein (Cas_Csd1)
MTNSHIPNESGLAEGARNMLVVDWSKETAFLLGRQFAVYELIQVASRDRGFHGTIMTDLYQAAASEPRRIFPLLDRRCEIDLARIGGDRKRLKLLLKTEVSRIKKSIPTGGYDRLPALLPDGQDDLFAAGYCHQRRELFGAADAAGGSTATERSAPAHRHAEGGRHAPRVSPMA